MAECSRDGCARAVAHRGMCASHYQVAWREHGEAWRAERDALHGDCSIDDCGKPARKRGWCHMHYQRWRQHGDANHGRVINPLCVRCGGTEKRRNASGKMYCRTCAAANATEYRSRNADEIRETKRAYHERTSEARQTKERSRAYYQANREAHRAKTREWVLAHPDLRRQYARAWYYRNKDRAFQNVAARRARMLDAICEHGPKCVTGEFLREIKSRVCVYCGAPAEHADHVVPVTRGGLHCQANIAPACRHCNQSKNNRLLDEWKRAV